jgi:hypothetical protein
VRTVNIQWKHGVNYIEQAEQQLEMIAHRDKVDSDITVGRISIILWGLCPHVKEESHSPPMLTDNTRGLGHSIQHQRDGDRHRRRSRERSVHRDPNPPHHRDQHIDSRGTRTKETDHAQKRERARDNPRNGRYAEDRDTRNARDGWNDRVSRDTRVFRDVRDTEDSRNGSDTKIAGDVHNRDTRYFRGGSGGAVVSNSGREAYNGTRDVAYLRSDSKGRYGDENSGHRDGYKRQRCQQ